MGYHGSRKANLQYLMQDADGTLSSVIDDSALAQLLAIGGDVSDFNDATDSLEALSDAIAAISASGTPNAFLAAVGGALDDAAASGAVTDVDTAMAYIKQLVTASNLMSSQFILQGTSPNTSGTANTSTRIELDSNASSVDGTYDPGIVVITGGTGSGQARQIWEYDGTNKYAYVNRDWKVTPDDTSEYALIANSGNSHVNEGLAQGGTNNTITLNALASDQDNLYLGQMIFIAAGTGADQSRMVIGYNGTTKVVTVDANWIVNPDATSVYAMYPHPGFVHAAGTADAAANILMRDVIGNKADAAAAGTVTATESLMAYAKQLVTYNEAGTCVRGVPQAVGTIAYANVAQADDTGDGLTPATAKKTINAAIDVAGAGGVVISKAGTYVENVDLDETAIEFWPEIGTVIAPASGTPLTVSANFSKVWCPGGALKIIPAANETGVAVTGQFCYLSDIRVTGASTADIGFYVGSAADNTDGDGSVLTDCRCSAPLIAAFKLQADKLRLDTCCTGGESGDSSIGFWALPDASGVMDKLRLRDCGSQGHETAGYQIDSGCTNGAIEASYSGGGDGRWVDNGTNFTWPNFSFDDEVIKVNTLSVAGGGGTSSYNLFKVTGAVKVSNIYADVDTALTGTNTDCFLELYSVNGSVAISKDDDGKTLGTLGVGSIVMRLDKEDKVLVVGDVSSGPALIDQTDIKEEGFRVIQDHTGGSGVDTYIRFVHTCADTGTGVLHWHCKWEPVDESGFLEAA